MWQCSTEATAEIFIFHEQGISIALFQLRQRISPGRFPDLLLRHIFTVLVPDFLDQERVDVDVKRVGHIDGQTGD